MDAPLTAEPNYQPRDPVSLDALAQLFWPWLSWAAAPQSSTSLDSPTAPLSPAAIARLSPTALAYIGDAVYELHIRSQLLFPPQRQQAYHRQVVAQVRAEQQAATLETWVPLLTDAEQDLVRRGRNSVGKRSRHNNPVAYQNATGFEALVGYLFLADPSRLTVLLESARRDPAAQSDEP